MKKVIIQENIYTYHIDFAGHVSNIVYIQWMEIGRLKLLEAAGMPVDVVVQEYGLLPTLVETRIRYKKQLFLGDSVRIEVWLSRLNNASAVMEFRFYNNSNHLVATGQQTGLFVDSKSHRPCVLEPAKRDCFMPYVSKA